MPAAGGRGASGSSAGRRQGRVSGAGAGSAARRRGGRRRRAPRGRPPAGQRSESPKGLVESAGEEYARRFLAGLLSGDAALAARFARGMGAPPPRGLDYGKLVDEAFREAAVASASRIGSGGARVELGGVLRSAGEFEASGDLAEASRIYGQIAGAIIDNEGFDLEGDQSEAGAEAVRKWAECLAGSGPSAAARREAIGRAFGVFKGGGMLHGAYGVAMMALCSTDADLEHLLGLARPHAQPPPASAGRRRGRRVSREECDRRRMVSLVVEILDRLGRTRAANRLIAGHARSSPGACALLVSRLSEAGSKRKAADAAVSGLDRLGADPAIEEAALSIYGRGDPVRTRAALLTGLFVRTGDERYYELLRRLPGWERERPSFIRAVSVNARFRRFFLADILVRERMYREAIEEIAASGDIDLFWVYRAKLSAARPRAYLAAYGRHIEALGGRASSAEQCANISKHLGHLSRARAGGREAAARIAAGLAKKYPRRRNLAAALGPFLR